MIYHIKDFIKDGKNCTPAFVAAVAGLAEGDTLLLDGGVYHLYPEGAFEKEYYIFIQKKSVVIISVLIAVLIVV